MPHEFQHDTGPTWCIHFGKFEVYCRDDDECDRRQPGRFDAETQEGHREIARIIAGASHV